MITTDLIIVPIGCQYNFPGMEVCSGGFLVYTKPPAIFLF